MKKLLTIVSIMMLLMISSAFATDTRTMTMGDNGNVLVDNANMFSYYGRTFNYPNIATGEIATGSGLGEFGINWKFGGDNPWVLGTYFSSEELSLPSAVNWDELDVLGADIADQRIGIYYGRMLNNMNFGFHFGYKATSWSSDAVSNDAEEKFGEFTVGFGLTEATGKWDLAAAVSLGSITDQDSAYTATDKDSWTGMSLMARYFHEMNPTMTVVPHVGIATSKNSVIYDPAPVAPTVSTSWESKETMYEIGIGLNYTPSSNVLAVADLGFQVMSDETTDVTSDGGDPAVLTTVNMKETYTSMPYWKIGMEADVFSWMDIRMGATSNWVAYKYEGVEKVNAAVNATYLGFGFNWGRLYVDAQTDPGLFLNGFDFVSGSGTGSMNSRISVLYEMF